MVRPRPIPRAVVREKPGQGKRKKEKEKECSVPRVAPVIRTVCFFGDDIVEVDVVLVLMLLMLMCGVGLWGSKRRST